MSYRDFKNRDQEKDNNYYDFVVIGSGMSGSTCATLLGRYGHRVLILEAHEETVGGCTHNFSISGNKEQFCSGTHYINISSDPLMRAVWADITNNLSYTRSPKNQIIDIYPGVGSYSSETFEDVMGIRKKEFSKLMSYTYFLIGIKLLNSFLAKIIYFIYSFFGYKALVTMNYFDWCNKVEFKHPENADKIRWIAAGDHSMSRSDCPAVVQATIMSHYCNGITKPDGWMPNTVSRIVSRINERGGAVLNNAKVTELVFGEGGRCIGVKVEDGTTLTVRNKTSGGVVCAGGTRLLYNLAPVNSDLRKELEPCLKMGISAQHGSVFLIFKNKTPQDLGLPDDEANLWIDEKYFISHKYDSKNKSTIVYIISECKYFERGPDYLENKENYADELMKMATDRYPKLAHYDAFDAATPATAEKWLHSDRGCSYGLRQPAERFGDYNIIRALRPTTCIPGLWQSSQDILFWGVLGAMMDGAVAAFAILNPSPILMPFPFVGGPNLFKDLMIDYGKLRKQEENKEK